MEKTSPFRSFLEGLLFLIKNIRYIIIENWRKYMRISTPWAELNNRITNSSLQDEAMDSILLVAAMKRKMKSNKIMI